MAAAIGLTLWASGLFDLWEFAAWRWRVRFFAEPVATSRNIKLILLDQNSLTWGEKENGWPWPWPREVYAPIVDFCARNKARAVIFDLLFTEPSFYGADDDRALGSAMNRAPAFVVPMFLGRTSGNAKAWPPDVSQRLTVGIANLDAWLTNGGREAAVMPRAAFPVIEVTASSAVLGSVSQDPDFDGIFRRCQLFQVFDGHVVPSLGLAAFLAGKSSGPAAQSSGMSIPGPETAGEIPAPKKASREDFHIENGFLRGADRSIPIDSSGKALVRFRGPASTYETFSAAAVIQSELRLREGGKPVIENGKAFEDSYVFLGASAPGLMDLRPTPISRVYPGVEFHAAMLDNLLAGDFLRDAPKWIFVPMTFALAIFGAVLIVTGTKARHSVAAVTVFLPAAAAIGFLAYPLGYWWPIVPQTAAVILSLAAAVFINYVSEGRQKAFIKKAFKHYLSPAVIDKILQDPSRLELGGERRELSIFFSDLQGFSSISERLDPHALTSLLNDYLSDMTDIILEEGGTLDKYEGDAIIAFWNAPLDQPDHALRACRAAVRCQRKLAERRDEFYRRTGVQLYARIGINTGPVVVGNMGSRKRFDYTVLGDAANLASRLEGANKAFGTFTMVSESTWVQAGGELLGREMGLLRVVGRKTPVRVYELIGLSSSERRDGLEEFRLGLESFYARDWAAAREKFSGLQDDPVAVVYERRCRCLLEEADASCDCVWNLTEK